MRWWTTAPPIMNGIKNPHMKSIAWLVGSTEKNRSSSASGSTMSHGVVISSSAWGTAWRRTGHWGPMTGENSER